MLRALRTNPSLQGWRFGIWLNVICTISVLAINLGVTIWALSSSDANDGEIRRVLFQGNCAQVKKINTAGHAVINALSTLLLGASNYSMQCLAAPNRKDIDGAHKKQRWLNIGTHSMRNFKFSPVKFLRRCLWFLLLFSSMPLHLFYNSALFSALNAIEYNVVTTTDDFLGPNRRILSPPSTEDTLYAMALSGSLEKLENRECITAYGQDFQGARSNLIVILANETRSSRTTSATYQFGSGGGVEQSFDRWLCKDIQQNDKALNGKQKSGFCSAYLAELRANPSEWTVTGSPVKYCLSQPAGDICKLYFSPPIASVVIGMNFIKAVAIGLVLYTLKDAPLLTLGDAVGSFLEFPDETTESMGVVSRKDFRLHNGYATWISGPKPYDGSRQRRIHATGRARMWGFVAFYVGMILLMMVFFSLGIIRFEGGPSWDKIWGYGIGSVNAQTVITGAPDLPLIAVILLSNVPQLALSAVYFWYNNILTSIAMAMEWDQFGFIRKGLRVSTPQRGSQRGSYMLQLPYRLAVPLMITSGVLHWLASQSLFLADIDYVQSDPPVPKSSSGSTNKYGANGVESHFSTCGYSPLAILLLVLLAVVMVIILIIISMTRFLTGMPVAGNCSAAISAACHGLAKPGSGASEKPVMWGEVVVHEVDGTLKRRCAFTSEEVSKPVEGRIYPEDVGLGRSRSASLESGLGEEGDRLVSGSDG
ncbi:hypothetical protein B0T16DRAFT_455664 [Cercophora newfieldiana]|uniref:DUF6536 domain-containing protein n=1 Tax=Cercophora newfieldiana TaxID=92897 RepID=A0AA40CT59_9PEZI|nr:hypothetical protein B0T16DRAFT_455664 [Cercophora newfieldiana]